MKEENQKLKGIEIRDRRNGDWLWIHKCVIECWAKIIKPQGVTLYCLLANFDFNPEHPGIVYPNQKTMADRLGWSRQTVNKWIGILERNKLITIEKRSRYYLIYYLNKVKCPNSKNGIHRDIKRALHLKKGSNFGNQMSNSANSDVKQRNTNKKKEKEQIKKRDGSSFKDKIEAYKRGEKWEGKPYFRGEEMRWWQNKFWVIPKERGQWLEFVGQESEIEWRK